MTDSNERVRKLFENRPMEAPTPKERYSKPRKTFAKAAAEEEEETVEDAAPEAEASDEEGAEADAPETGEAPFIEDDAEE